MRLLLWFSILVIILHYGKGLESSNNPNDIKSNVRTNLLSKDEKTVEKTKPRDSNLESREKATYDNRIKVPYNAITSIGENGNAVEHFPLRKYNVHDLEPAWNNENRLLEPEAIESFDNSLRMARNRRRNYRRRFLGESDKNEMKNDFENPNNHRNQRRNYLQHLIELRDHDNATQNAIWGAKPLQNEYDNLEMGSYLLRKPRKIIQNLRAIENKDGDLISNDYNYDGIEYKNPESSLIEDRSWISDNNVYKDGYQNFNFLKGNQPRKNFVPQVVKKQNEDISLKTIMETKMNELLNSGVTIQNVYMKDKTDHEDKKGVNYHKRIKALKRTWEKLLPDMDQFRIDWEKSDIKDGATNDTSRQRFNGPFRGWRIRNTRLRKAHQEGLQPVIEKSPETLEENVNRDPQNIQNADNTENDKSRDRVDSVGGRSYIPRSFKSLKWEKKPLVSDGENANQDFNKNKNSIRKAFTRKDFFSEKLKNDSVINPKKRLPLTNNHNVNKFRNVNKNSSHYDKSPVTAKSIEQPHDKSENRKEQDDNKNTILDWRDQFMSQIKTGLEWASDSIKKELKNEKTSKDSDKLSRENKDRDWKGQLQNQIFSRAGLSKQTSGNNAVGNNTTKNRMTVEELRELWGRQITKQRSNEQTGTTRQAAQPTKNNTEAPQLPNLKTSSLQESRDAWEKQIVGSDHYLQKKYQTAERLTMGDLRDSWQKQILDDEELMNRTFPTYNKPHFEVLMEMVQKKNNQRGNEVLPPHQTNPPRNGFRRNVELRHKRENFPITEQPKQKRSLIFNEKEIEMNQLLKETSGNSTNATKKSVGTNDDSLSPKTGHQHRLNAINANYNSTVPRLESILLENSFDINTTNPSELKNAINGATQAENFDTTLKNVTTGENEYLMANTYDTVNNADITRYSEPKTVTNANKTAAEFEEATQLVQRFKTSFQTINDSKDDSYKIAKEDDLENKQKVHDSAKLWNISAEPKMWQKEPVRVVVTPKMFQDSEKEFNVISANVTEPKTASQKLKRADVATSDDDFTRAKENVDPALKHYSTAAQNLMQDNGLNEMALFSPNILSQSMPEIFPASDNEKPEEDIDHTRDFIRHPTLSHDPVIPFPQNNNSPSEQNVENQKIEAVSKALPWIQQIPEPNEIFSPRTVKNEQFPSGINIPKDIIMEKEITEENETQDVKEKFSHVANTNAELKRFYADNEYSRQSTASANPDLQFQVARTIQKSSKDLTDDEYRLHPQNTIFQHDEFSQSDDETVANLKNEGPIFSEDGGSFPLKYTNARRNTDATLDPRHQNQMQLFTNNGNDILLSKHVTINDDFPEDGSEESKPFQNPPLDFEREPVAQRNLKDDETSILRFLNRMINEKPIPIPMKLGKIRKPENYPQEDEEKSSKEVNLSKARKLLEMAPKLNVRRFYDTLAAILSTDRNVWQKKFAENPFADIVLAKFKEYLPIAFKQAKLNTSYNIKYPKSQELDLTITNVIGVLPGRKEGLPTDAFLIIGAHYDSADSVENSEEFHNRASGIALLLEILRSLASSDWQFDNSIYFVAFDLGEVDRVGSSHFVKHYLIPKVIESGRGSLKGAYILNTLMAYNNTPNSQRLPYELSEFVPQVARAVSENKNRGDFYLVSARKNTDIDLAEKLGFYWNLMTSPNFRLYVAEINLPEVKRHKIHSIFNDGDHRNFWEVGDDERHVLKAVHIGDTDYARLSGECTDIGCQEFSTITPSSLLFVKKLGEALIAACLDFGDGKLAEFRSPLRRRAIFSTPQRIIYRNPRFPVNSDSWLERDN